MVTRPSWVETLRSAPAVSSWVPILLRTLAASHRFFMALMEAGVGWESESWAKAHLGIVDPFIRFRYHADPDHMRNPLKQEVAVPPVIDKVTFAGPFADRFRNKCQIAGLVPGKAFPRRKPLETGALEPADGDTRLGRRVKDLVPAHGITTEFPRQAHRQLPTRLFIRTGDTHT